MSDDICMYVCLSMCSFVESDIQSSLSSLYKCSDVLARRVQERALAAMFGELLIACELIMFHFSCF